jgi:hypothetical protein
MLCEFFSRFVFEAFSKKTKYSGFGRRLPYSCVFFENATNKNREKNSHNIKTTMNFQKLERNQHFFLPGQRRRAEERREEKDNTVQKRERAEKRREGRPVRVSYQNDLPPARSHARTNETKRFPGWGVTTEESPTERHTDLTKNNFLQILNPNSSLDSKTP